MRQKSVWNSIEQISFVSCSVAFLHTLISEQDHESQKASVPRKPSLPVSMNGWLVVLLITQFRKGLLGVATRLSMTSKESKVDLWSAQADLYANQAARLTELHGADLIAILKEDILKAKTILDVGCGTGAFAKAYLQQFPTGIPGQTLILSDLSPGMLGQAKATVRPPDDYQTEIIFQEEDATKLLGIESNSIDMVVSLFGVFLIPDQQGTVQAIKRVMKDNGIFANASWRFKISESLAEQGYGVSIQDAFQVPIKTIDPKKAADASYLKTWSKRGMIKQMLVDDYNFASVQCFSAIHTSVWGFEDFWTMIAKNPMANIQGAPNDEVARAKQALQDFVLGDAPTDQAMPLSSASILTVARFL